MWKCKTHKVHQVSTRCTKSHGYEDRERLLAGNMEMSLSHGVDGSDRSAAESKHPDFWDQMHSQEHTRKLEVPYTGQMWSRRSEVWWADVIQARKCWPSNKQRQWKYTASPVDFGTNWERTFSSQNTQTTSSLQTSVQTEGRQMNWQMKCNKAKKHFSRHLVWLAATLHDLPRKRNPVPACRALTMTKQQSWTRSFIY